MVFICYLKFGFILFIFDWNCFLFIREVKKKIWDWFWVFDDGVFDRVWVCIVFCDMKLGLLFIFNRVGDKDFVVFDELIFKEIVERKKKFIV